MRTSPSLHVEYLPESGVGTSEVVIDAVHHYHGHFSRFSSRIGTNEEHRLLAAFVEELVDAALEILESQGYDEVNVRSYCDDDGRFPVGPHRKPVAAVEMNGWQHAPDLGKAQRQILDLLGLDAIQIGGGCSTPLSDDEQSALDFESALIHMRELWEIENQGDAA